MLEQNPSLYIVIISLLSVAMFNFLNTKQKNELGMRQQKPFFVLLEVFIYIGVIYLSFSELKWWLAIINIAIVYLVTNLLSAIICAMFIPKNFNEPFIQAYIDKDIETAQKEKDLNMLKKLKIKKRRHVIGMYFMFVPSILLIISAVLVGIQLFS